MDNNSRGTDVAVILGIALVAFGAIALVSPIFGPIQAVLWFLARVGWPIVLIVVGLLFIMRARGRGWSTSGRTFRRSRNDRMIGGVIGGLAMYLGVNAFLLRIACVLLTVVTGVWAGVVAYLVAMLVVAEEPLPADYAPPPAPEAPKPPPATAPAPPAAPTPPASAPTPQAPEPPKAPAAPEPPKAPSAPSPAAPAAPEPPDPSAVPPGAPFASDS